MIKQLLSALNGVLLGKEEVVELAVCCLLAKGHLLIEDLPGMGKTTLSHALAQLTGMAYRRIQFTSDLLPTDIIGVSIFDANDNQFHFHRGPIFNQLILADEINRASPKTQSALLEAMEEHQVTTDEGTIVLPHPFFVIATQNPSYHTGTYALPESQLDRFLMCISIGYPPPEQERKLLLAADERKAIKEFDAIIDVEQLSFYQQKVEEIHVADPLLDYVQTFLNISRNSGWFKNGLSPRTGRAIIGAARAKAYINARDFLIADDIQAILSSVVDHRLHFRSSSEQVSPAQQLLNHVEVPV